MKVRETWSTPDFDDMGWHDGRLYSIVVPDEDFKLTLDVDYIFKSDRSEGEYKGFWVSPCDMVFENVSGFKSAIDYKDRNLLFINEIKRSNRRLTPNKKFTE